MLYSACKAISPQAKEIFTCCLKMNNGWNLTPHFDILMWQHLLQCAGRLNDPQFVEAARVLRHTGPAFAEDPLRVLRGLQAFDFPLRGWSRTAKHIDGVQTFAGPAQWHEFLGGCRVLVNLLPVPLFYGVHLLLGSLPPILALLLWRSRWAVPMAAIAALPTLKLWGHPWAVVIFTAEVAWLQLALKRWNGSPRNDSNGRVVSYSILYWLLIGTPLVLLFYGLVMHIDAANMVVVAVKQSFNGVFNTVLAFAAVVAIRWRQADRGRGPGVSLRGVIAAVVMLAITVPTLLVSLGAGHQLEMAVESGALDGLQTMNLAIAQTDTQLAMVRWPTRTSASRTDSTRRWSAKAAELTRRSTPKTRPMATAIRAYTAPWPIASITVVPASAARSGNSVVPTDTFVPAGSWTSTTDSAPFWIFAALSAESVTTVVAAAGAYALAGVDASMRIRPFAPNVTPPRLRA